MSYVPPEHLKYDLLPHNRGADDWETFSYPGECGFVSDMLRAATQALAGDAGSSAIPYNYPSCDAYYAMLENEARRVEGAYPFLALDLRNLRLNIEEMNDKSVWSVLRYLGEDDDPACGLTHGRCYYWPCREASPIYEGVVDNEEFTSYRYDPDPVLWEVFEDPTGMARATLAKYAASSESLPSTIENDDPRPFDVCVQMAAKLAFDERDLFALLAQGCPRDEFELEAREVAKRLGGGDFDAVGAAPVIKSVIEDMFACESSLEEGLAIARGMDARLKLAAKAAR